MGGGGWRWGGGGVEGKGSKGAWQWVGGVWAGSEGDGCDASIIIIISG